MSTKKLALIFIILLAGAYLYSGPAKDWAKSLGDPSAQLAKINPEKVEKIEIIKDTASTTLLKIGDKFKVDNTKDFYIDDEVAQKITDSLREMKNNSLELVSSEENKKAEFGIASSSGLEVKIFPEGQKAIDLIIGNLSGDFLKNYISFENLPNTYSVGQNLLSLFDRDDWRSKTIFAQDQAKITKLRFQTPNYEFVLEKKALDNPAKAASSTEEAALEYIWQGVKPYQFSVNSEKINEVLAIMANLTAAKIPEQKFAGTGLEKNSLIVEAIGEDLDNIIMIGDMSEGLYFAKRGDSDNIYLILEEERNILARKIEDLK